MFCKRYLLVILVMVMASACSDTRPGQSAKSLPDNPENRTVLAKQYLEIMKPKDMLQSVAGRVVPRLPEKDRKPFTDIMNSPAIEESAYRITLDGLVKHFTVGELNAMLAFYGSPDGQSASKKYGSYLGEIMPQIQQEVKKAVAEVEKQQAPQKPAAPGPQTGPPASMEKQQTPPKPATPSPQTGPPPSVEKQQEPQKPAIPSPQTGPPPSKEQKDLPTPK
jgi:Uncharacterized protein conserved in bacteria (DUF2059)